MSEPNVKFKKASLIDTLADDSGKHGAVHTSKSTDESELVSWTESQIEDYDADQPIKCPKCLHMVVPIEGKVCSGFQACHMMCCFICVLKKWCKCDVENQELRNTVLNCPHCNSIIAAH